MRYGLPKSMAWMAGVDTYKYNEEEFLNDINTALTKEFPALTIFGEVGLRPR